MTFLRRHRLVPLTHASGVRMADSLLRRTHLRAGRLYLKLARATPGQTDRRLVCELHPYTLKRALRTWLLVTPISVVVTIPARAMSSFRTTLGRQNLAATPSNLTVLLQVKELGIRYPVVSYSLLRLRVKGHHSTGGSREITQHSTNPAQPSLTSEIGRDLVFSWWYDRGKRFAHFPMAEPPLFCVSW